MAAKSTALVPYPKRNGAYSSNSADTAWPNRKTALASISIIINIACLILKTRAPVTVALNMPTRIASIILHQQDYSKVAFEVVSLAALFFPYGQFASIAIDATGEVINYLNSTQVKLPSLPRCFTREKKSTYIPTDSQRDEEDSDKADIRIDTATVIRNFQDSRDKCLAFVAKPRTPITTEEEARKIFRLPQEGPIDFKDLKITKDAIIRHNQGAIDQWPKSRDRFLFESIIQGIQEAYDVLIKSAAVQPENADH